MNQRVVFASLLLLLSPWAMADQQAPAKTAPADPTAAARARLDATRGQAHAEDANVKQLKARVDALESSSDKAARELAERDRKIAELERQLATENHP